MKKRLVIAEKPSVARDLSRVLGATQQHKNYFEGKDVIVTWALGHLLSLKMPEEIDRNWQKWQMETLPMIPKKIGIKPLPKTRGQLKTIQNLVKRSDISEAVIATDAGREGELVARWILEWVRFNKPVKRLWISSQTDKAIKTGFANLKPAEAYNDLYYSALARAQADWLVGLNVTRALTVKYQDNLSAGRVQTPTLALVREQEKKIEKFIPKKYFVVNLKVGQKTAQYVTKNPQALTERAAAEKLVKKLQVTPGKVSEIQVKDRYEAAPLPYDLTELQREANARYNYSAKQTLSLVQSLYEKHKVVSYPRTDSKYLSTDLKATMKERLLAVRNFAPEQVQKYLKQGAKVVQQKVFNNSKVSDHHALIPTEQVPNYAKFSNDEQRIYNLIVARFLGLFAPVHHEKQAKIMIEFGQNLFKLQQTTVIEAGWKENTVTEQEQVFTVGEKINPQFNLEEKLTQPPRPLTEGTLLGKMEHYGLGTPATRAEIIDKLIRSELLERQGNSLRVTPKGKQLLNLVNPELATPKLTAKWEKELEAIAQGKYNSQKFLQEIKNDTKRLVREIKNSEQKYQDFSLTQKPCPECGAMLKVRKTRDGEIYVCSNQECDYRRRKEARVSNHRCPQCHKKMLIMEGKNGKYFRCKYDGTTEKMTGKKERKKKMNKREERRLLKKINQDQEPQESALAQALKAALGQED
ncbi:DNA topoisomerase III [Ligilactobacillus ceti]|uniref:DNA topoisomerase n=1 Tax=Ligilactobacillus ceti DSM 22408 TaxID=1122146 RepID=A0A0R2KM95_9LACO|nr:DNA topoisomerase III [Ligilactobacillus ceti]KRN90569.1 DNA topoisomerase III [Ligilactobacillus ceti DSM 22408]